MALFTITTDKTVFASNLTAQTSSGAAYRKLFTENVLSACKFALTDGNASPLMDMQEAIRVNAPREMAAFIACVKRFSNAGFKMDGEKVAMEQIGKIKFPVIVGINGDVKKDAKAAKSAALDLFANEGAVFIKVEKTDKEKTRFTFKDAFALADYSKAPADSSDVTFSNEQIAKKCETFATSLAKGKTRAGAAIAQMVKVMAENADTKDKEHIWVKHSVTDQEIQEMIDNLNKIRAARQA